MMEMEEESMDENLEEVEMEEKEETLDREMRKKEELKKVI